MYDRFYAGGEPAGRALATSARGARLRILLAEDSPAARLLTAALLDRLGCDVDTAEHGEDAVRQVRNFRYDAVLLDIEMPVMDGIAAARAIRSLAGPAGRTPLIALSAFLADLSLVDAWREPFDAALAKPAGGEELRRVIDTTLAAGRDQAAQALAADGRSGVVELIDSETFEAIRRQVVPSAWANLITSAMAEMAGFALRARQAAADGDRSGISHAGHDLKGIAASFGAVRLSRLAAGLELIARDAEPAVLETHAAAVVSCAEETAERVRMLLVQ